MDRAAAPPPLDKVQPFLYTYSKETLRVVVWFGALTELYLHFTGGFFLSP